MLLHGLLPHYFIALSHFDGVCWDGEEITVYMNGKGEQFVVLERNINSDTRSLFHQIW